MTTDISGVFVSFVKNRPQLLGIGAQLMKGGSDSGAQLAKSCWGSTCRNRRENILQIGMTHSRGTVITVTLSMVVNSGAFCFFQKKKNTPLSTTVGSRVQDAAVCSYVFM